MAFHFADGTMRCLSHVIRGLSLSCLTFWEPTGSILTLVAGFFGGSFTWVGICLFFSRLSFKYCVSTSMFMCESKGKCLVINSSYHINILFIIGPLFFYNTTYPSWLATCYSCPPFTMSMWSYHWRSRYPFDSVPLWEWAFSSPWHSSKYYYSYCFGKQNTCSKGGFPPFPSPHPMTIDILITKNDFHTLMDLVIANPTRTNMV